MVAVLVCLFIFIGFNAGWFYKKLFLLLGGAVWAVALSSLLIFCNVSGLFLTGVLSMWYLPVLILAVIFWVLGLGLVMGVSEFQTYLGHYTLVGLGQVLLLALPFLELISVCLRPLTLGVRLATNISSGHVLLAMGGLVSSCTAMSLLLIPAFVCLVLLELFVAFLQGCVFSILVLMYAQA